MSGLGFRAGENARKPFEKGANVSWTTNIPFEQESDTVDFLRQPEIEAVLLTALFAVIGWAFLQWWNSRRVRKEPGKSKNPSTRHQLPSSPPNFTGRDEELAKLEKELTSAHKLGANISGRHAGLQGMGGVGKTALATVLAHRLKDRYPDAQLYLNLRGADPEHRPPVAAADAMQSIIHVFHPEAKLPEALDQLRPIYHGVLNEAGRVLLFLDNAADGAQVKPLLPPANCLMLVTSRNHFSLPGLAARNTDCLRPEKSQELLLKLSKRIKGFEKDAAELCGHLPLALEVFAGVVNDNTTYSVADLLERLRRQPSKLTRAEAAFQVSYDLLAENLRRRWTALAVFPASFDLRAAAAVWADGGGASVPASRASDSARAAMQALVNASLVEWNEANGRFRLHDLVRQFLGGKLAEAERTAVNVHFAGHFRDVAVAAENLFRKGGDNVLCGLEIIDHERTHIEASFEWLQSQKDQESATVLVSMVDFMGNTGNLRFHPRQRINWLESQLLAARLIKDRKTECKVLGYLGVAYADLADARKAMEFFNQALLMSREIAYRRGESASLGHLGLAYDHLGEWNKAIQCFEEALAIDRKTSDRVGEASCLNNLGGIYRYMGDYSRTVEYYEQALSICRELGDRRNEATILANLGFTYSRLDDVHRGIDLIQKSLIITREIGDRHNEGEALTALGLACEQLGDSHKAIEYFELALESFRQSGDLRREGQVLCSIAVSLNGLGVRTNAIATAEQSLKILESIEDSAAALVRENLAKWRAKEP